MEGNSTNTVAAEVSIHDNGVIYIGIEAREKLGLSYNDNIKVEIPAIGRVIEGSLTSANQITADLETVSEAKDFGEKSQGATWHIDALVKKMIGSWDDDHGLTEERHEAYFTLDSKDV